MNKITFLLFFICVASILGCNFSEKEKQNNPVAGKIQVDSIRTLNAPKKRAFQGEKLWIKQFQCDGYFYTSKIFTDTFDNLFWFVNFEGILKIDSTNIFKNYSDRLLALQFDKDGNLSYHQYIGGNDQNLLQVLEFKNSFYPVFIFNGMGQSVGISIGNNQKFKQEEIKIYEISANKKASVYDNIRLEKRKRISTIEFDKNQNLIFAGSKAIEFENGMGQCEPYTRVSNSIPYIEKRKGDTLVWEFACTTNCLGKVSDLFIDEQNDIWVNFQISNCDEMSCFKTEKYSGDRDKTFIAKVSENGKLIFNNEIEEYHSKWLKLQKFKKDKILIHSNSSCFTYWGIKHSPVMVYDLNYNMKWEECFSDGSESRFDFQILPQDHQILGIGHKRTGMIQPGEKPKDYLGKQKVVFLRYDTLGNLKWQKSINEPLRVLDFEKGRNDKFYVMLEADLYLTNRIDYRFTIENEEFSTNKKETYFLIKYK